MEFRLLPPGASLRPPHGPQQESSAWRPEKMWQILGFSQLRSPEISTSEGLATRHGAPGNVLKAATSRLLQSATNCAKHGPAWWPRYRRYATALPESPESCEAPRGSFRGVIKPLHDTHMLISRPSFCVACVAWAPRGVHIDLL